MKINIFAIISCIIIACSFAVTLKIKTQSQNNFKFSTMNYTPENPQKPSLMESIISSKPIGVNSRMVNNIIFINHVVF